MRNYGEYVTQFVDQFPEGKMLTSEVVAQAVAQSFKIPITHAKTVTNNQLKRLADMRKIERLQKGIYFKAKQTLFGKTRPNLDQFAIQLLTTEGQQVIGYVTGATYMNHIGLTTLIPKEIEVVSNQYRKVLPAGCHVTARRPAVPVSTGNYKYLQLLDAIDAMAVEHIDAENANELIRKTARGNQIEPLHLINQARQHYSVRTLLRTVDIFTEVPDETS